MFTSLPARTLGPLASRAKQPRRATDKATTETLPCDMCRCWLSRGHAPSTARLSGDMSRAANLRADGQMNTLCVSEPLCARTRSAFSQAAQRAALVQYTAYDAGCAGQATMFVGALVLAAAPAPPPEQRVGAATRPPALFQYRWQKPGSGASMPHSASRPGCLVASRGATIAPTLPVVLRQPLGGGAGAEHCQFLQLLSNDLSRGGARGLLCGECLELEL